MEKTRTVIIWVFVALCCAVAFIFAVPFSRDYVLNQMANGSSNYKSTLQQCSNLSDENASLKNQTESLSGLITNYENEMQNLVGSYNTLTGDFDTVYNKITTIFDDYGLSIETNSTDKTVLASLKLDAIKTHIDWILDQAQIIEMQIDNLQNENLTLTNNIESLNAQINSLSYEIQEKNNQLTLLEEEYHNLNSQYNDCIENLNNLNEELALKNNEIINVNSELENIKTQVASKNREINELNVLIADLSTQIDVKNNEINNLNSQITDLTIQLNSNYTELNVANAEISRLNQQVEINNNYIDTVNQQMEDLTNEFNAVNANFNSLTRHINSVFANTGLTLEDTNLDAFELSRQQLEKINTYIETLSIQKSNLQSSLNTSQERSLFYQGMINRVSTQVSVGENANILACDRICEFVAPEAGTYVFTASGGSDYFINAYDQMIYSELTIDLDANENYYFILSNSGGYSTTTLYVQTNTPETTELYTVSYVVNGEVFYSYQSEAGVNAIAPPTMPEGCTGWNTEPNALFGISPEMIMVTTDLVFYAVF